MSTSDQMKKIVLVLFVTFTGSHLAPKFNFTGSEKCGRHLGGSRKFL